MSELTMSNDITMDFGHISNAALSNSLLISSGLWVDLAAMGSMIVSGVGVGNSSALAGSVIMTTAFILKDKIAEAFLNTERKRILSEELGEKRTSAAMKLGVVAKILDEENGFYLVKDAYLSEFQILNQEAFLTLRAEIAKNADEVLTLITPIPNRPGSAKVERWIEGKLHGPTDDEPAIMLVEEGEVLSWANYSHGVLQPPEPEEPLLRI